MGRCGRGQGTGRKLLAGGAAEPLGPPTPAEAVLADHGGYVSGLAGVAGQGATLPVELDLGQLADERHLLGRNAGRTTRRWRAQTRPVVLVDVGDELGGNGCVEQLGVADAPPCFGDPGGHNTMVTVAGDAVGTEGDDDIRSDGRDRVGDAVDRGCVVDQIAFAVG